MFMTGLPTIWPRKTLSLLPEDLSNQSTQLFGTLRQAGTYLFQSTVLVALAASIFQPLIVSNLKNAPKIAPTNEYPYRKASGELCCILKLI